MQNVVASHLIYCHHLIGFLVNSADGERPYAAGETSRNRQLFETTIGGAGETEIGWIKGGAWWDLCRDGDFVFGAPVDV